MHFPTRTARVTLRRSTARGTGRSPATPLGLPLELHIHYVAAQPASTSRLPLIKRTRLQPRAALSAGRGARTAHHEPPLNLHLHLHLHPPSSSSSSSSCPSSSCSSCPSSSSTFFPSSSHELASYSLRLRVKLSQLESSARPPADRLNQQQLSISRCQTYRSRARRLPPAAPSGPSSTNPLTASRGVPAVPAPPPRLPGSVA